MSLVFYSAWLDVREASVRVGGCMVRYVAGAYTWLFFSGACCWTKHKGDQASEAEQGKLGTLLSGVVSSPQDASFLHLAAATDDRTEGDAGNKCNCQNLLL